MKSKYDLADGNHLTNNLLIVRDSDNIVIGEIRKEGRNFIQSKGGLFVVVFSAKIYNAPDDILEGKIESVKLGCERDYAFFKSFCKEVDDIDNSLKNEPFIKA